VHDKREQRNQKNSRILTDSAEEKPEKDYKVLYDQLVDKIEIHYAEWAHLQLMKAVDIYKYEHLKLAPATLLSSPDFIYKAIWTILNHIGGA